MGEVNDLGFCCQVAKRLEAPGGTIIAVFDEKVEQVIREWIEFYNGDRPHSALGGRTPAEAYGAKWPVDMMDKADALPTSPQAQQQQKNLITRILAA